MLVIYNPRGGFKRKLNNQMQREERLVVFNPIVMVGAEKFCPLFFGHLLQYYYFNLIY